MGRPCFVDVVPEVVYAFPLGDSVQERKENPDELFLGDELRGDGRLIGAQPDHRFAHFACGPAGGKGGDITRQVFLMGYIERQARLVFRCPGMRRKRTDKRLGVFRGTVKMLLGLRGVGQNLVVTTVYVYIDSSRISFFFHIRGYLRFILSFLHLCSTAFQRLSTELFSPAGRLTFALSSGIGWAEDAECGRAPFHPGTLTVRHFLRASQLNVSL